MQTKNHKDNSETNFQIKFKIWSALFLAFSYLFVSPLLFTNTVKAQTAEWGGVCIEEGVATIQGLECLIANVFTVFLSLIGLAAFAMFIIASMTWMLAGTSTDKVNTAKSTMTNAVIGIVIALSAFIVINLLATFTGVESLKTFRIPTSYDQQGN